MKQWIGAALSIFIMLALPGWACTPTVSAEQLGTDDIARSVVLLRNSTDDMPRGAGFIVSDRHIVTADHLAENDLVAEFYDGERRGVETVQRHVAGLDVGILEVAVPDGYRPLPISCRRTRRGDRVRTVGHPVPILWAFASGRVASHRSTSPGDTDINIDLNIGRGNSGSPVVDDSGYVVGVIRGYLTQHSPLSQLPVWVMLGYAYVAPTEIMCSADLPFPVNREDGS